MKEIFSELRKILVIILLRIIHPVIPKGEFKLKFSEFLIKNIPNL